MGLPLGILVAPGILEIPWSVEWIMLMRNANQLRNAMNAITATMTWMMIAHMPNFLARCAVSRAPL
jgi:hypothetical protein